MSPSARRDMRSGRRGFSLVELLVVIGVIGLLLAIVMPALAGARVSARQTQALANVRTIGQAFGMYADREKGYPSRLLGEPIPEREDLEVPPDGIAVRWGESGVLMVTDYFAQAWLWPGLVYAPDEWPANYKTWISPGMRNDPALLDPIEAFPNEWISVRYSHAFIARPELFREGATADPSLLRGTRPDEVMFPAEKVMLWDAHVAYLPKEPERVGEHYQAPAAMAFADLHADVRDPTEATPGVANPMRMELGPTTLHSTPGGVKGRDYAG